MARFVRGTQIFDVWLEPGPEPETWRMRVVTRDRPGAEPEYSKADSWGSRREYLRHQLEHLEAGWSRAVDPDREDDFDEPRNAELDAALLATPGDIASLLVYADWLQQRGHPRGQLIATQHARTLADTPELAAAEADLLEAHAGALLGPIGAWIRTGERDAGVDLRWNRGFLEYARFDGFHERGDTEDNLWDLLRHPSARFLHTLEIGCHRAGDQDNTLICATLIHAGPTPPLRRLVIGDFDQDDYNGIDISRAPIGDLSLLSTAYPLLEEVILKGTGDVELGTLDLPHARVFALRTSTLRATTVAAIAAARWPALAELELWTGDDEYGGDCTLDDLAPLFAPGKFPALRRLRIMNTPLSDELCLLLVTSPHLAAQLEQIDFSLGTLSDTGAATLATSRIPFPRLRSLDVFHCSLSPAGLERLRRAGFPVQEVAPAKRWEINSRPQKPRRYISNRE
jgi:uncharacterized protein (TIGR02996 family)